MVAIPPTWKTVSRIERALNAGPSVIPELMGLTRREYRKIIDQKLDFSTAALLRLGQQLHLSFDLLMTDSFCYRTLVRQFQGEKTVIPEKYLNAGRTKTRVLLNLLDFIERASDEERRMDLMRHLQINEVALHDPNETINLQCSIDAIEWLERRSGPSVLKALGEEILLAPQNKPVLNELRGCRTLEELFDALFFESGVLHARFEKNFVWKVDKVVPGESITVRGYLNQELRDQLSEKCIRSAGGATVRAGMLGATPKILGLNRVPVAYSEFFDRDADSCALEMDISRISRPAPNPALSLVR